MPYIDVKELSPRNRDMRTRRIRNLKKSIAERHYQVNSDDIANGMILESFRGPSFK